ncbi:MAG: 23S rRNA (adenine(2503)-C(2))-methyltransferase RlmN [candidate division Zixibacteria bacterium HGW-Zixibacteria-1]|nr:MAG: 23S rRNA (adenine(2503)-C(2))-methyltransferase RlmN [candidate division Zixibacteria bacterium HGW-Zixibacteria-1]
MEKTNLLGVSLSELGQMMMEMGEKEYKSRQLFKWFYNLLESDFERMTDLSVKLRKKLSKRYFFKGLDAADVAVSSDGTEKYLFRLSDGKLIESVLIPDGQKRTVCISSQAGCPLKCSFCATGLMGFGRDLTVGEIIGQLLFLRQKYGEEAFRNIVFMGMGEPLLNYENVIKSVEIISSELGLSVSAKKITISTVGIVPQIYALADSDLKVNLAISLHAADDDKRRKIMPIARKYGLDELMKAVRYFADQRKKRVTFEYILFKDFNDSTGDADTLAQLIKGIPCKINILAYNPIDNLPYKRPSEEEVDNFGKYLYPLAPAVTVRKSRGLDIAAACGQLAGKAQHFEEDMS